MAIIWAEDAVAGWVAVPLRGESYDLSSRGPSPEPWQDVRGELPAIRLLPTTETDDQWVLVTEAGSSVRVNGVLLSLGIRVLRHRDEILVPAVSDKESRRYFFSGECVVVARPMPKESGPVKCPRCRKRIASGTPAVQCPNPACGAWHHQSEASPCWSSGEHCSLCETPAVLKAGSRWSPEDL